MSDELKEDIQFYEKVRDELESRSIGKWVLIHSEILIGEFFTFEEAAERAVKDFGSGPYLIRQVGAPPVVLPASVMYNVRHA